MGAATRSTWSLPSDDSPWLLDIVQPPGTRAAVVVGVVVVVLFIFLLFFLPLGRPCLGSGPNTYKTSARCLYFHGYG
jgi:hypothetical protein